jgi:hypothetical protein
MRPTARSVIDGYQLVLKASALQNDPAMEFAAAVIAQGSANVRKHLGNAGELR